MKEIKPENLHGDPFTIIGKEWMLVTAENKGKVNTMTASWGGVGILWNKPVAFVFLRPQRYTKEFVDASTHLSLSFYDKEYRDKMSYLGSVSGKEEDKIKNADLHVAHMDDVPYFEEANTVLLCRKLYAQPLDKNCFIESAIKDANYPLNDYHTMYVVEIEKVLSK